MGGRSRGRAEQGALPLRRLRRAPSYVRVRAIRALNRALDRAETARGGDGPLAHPPVFVVGAPRSGSTLLYQVLVQAFDVCYLSNRHCALWGSPSLVERFWHPDPAGGFTSRFGTTSGPAAPAECGPFWYRFFRRSPQYMPLADADPERLHRLRSAVRALGNAAGRPIVFKNLLNSLRLEPIGTALPEAVFVLVRRDLLANAASLLRARQEIGGDYAAWWSAEPPEIDELRTLPPEAQAVEQVRRIEALVERDRERLGACRFLELRYEELCTEPPAALAAVEALAERNGFRLARRRPVPAKFEPSAGKPIDPDLHARLVTYVGKS